MTTESEVGSAMSQFGYAYEILYHKKHDAINIYPPKSRKHVNKIWLRFRCKLSHISLTELMWHALTDEEFQKWSASQWEEWLCSPMLGEG